MLVGYLLLVASPARAWGTHYLVTDRALSRPDVAWTSTEVTVEPLDAFVVDQKDALTELFRGYYAWLAARGSHRFAAVAFDPATPTVAELLDAARLSPSTPIPYVRRPLPGDDSGPLLPATEVSPAITDKLPIRTSFVATPPGSTVTAGDVVTTYADEPDWGMDNVLFPIARYGYGEQPYGKADGDSSNAPFHMLFGHENFLVRTFARDVTEGLVADRIEQATRLSKLALATGHPYWGYRFAAWAVHYAEDIGMPYHSRAIPGAGAMYYLRYVISPAKGRMEEKATNVEGNRHLVYEDFVAYNLQRSYTTTEADPAGLAAFPARGDLVLAGVADTDALVDRVGGAAAAHARAVDRVIARAFDRRLTSDWRYDVVADPDYRIADQIAKMDPARASELLEATGVDFENTGVAARTTLALCGLR